MFGLFSGGYSGRLSSVLLYIFPFFSRVTVFSHCAWVYQTETQLRGVPISGGTGALFSGGGYSAELGVNRMTAKEVINELESSDWLDGQTRVVFLEFTLYNPSVNSFQTVMSIFEVPTFGGINVIQKNVINTYQVYSYGGADKTTVFLCQLIFVAHFFGSIYGLHKDIRRQIQKVDGAIYQKIKLFFNESVWNCLDFVLVMIDVCIITTFILKTITAEKSLAKFYDDEGRKFVNFAQVMLISEYFILFLSSAIFFGLIRLLKLLRFNQKIGLLSTILKSSAKNMGGVLMAFLLIMVSHVVLMHNVFGNFSRDYRSIWSSFNSLFLFLLGRQPKTDWSEYGMTVEILGKLCFLSFSVMNVILVTNFVVSVINADIGRCEIENLKENRNNYEFVGFVGGRCMDFGRRLKVRVRTIMK